MDSVLVNGAYLQVQIIVFWNEIEKTIMKKRKKKNRLYTSNTMVVDDEVF